MLQKDGHLLRIFIGESDKHGHEPLFEWIVKKAKEEGLAGATVIKGTFSFGANSRIHSSNILRLSEDLPIIIEIVDSIEKIEKFLPVIDSAIKEGLATIEKVQIRFYRSSKKE